MNDFNIHTIINSDSSYETLSPARRIARHYKFGIQKGFERFPDAHGLIIVEDDMLFSPDFLDFFHRMYPIMIQNKDIYAISAWNDNANHYVVNDRTRIRLTDFFPGLGWLCSRAFWKKIESHWPDDDSGWDWGLRRLNLGSVLHPEVPRVKHIGMTGTFMKKPLHDRLFKNVIYNQDPSFDWTQIDIGYLYKYDVFFKRKIGSNACNIAYTYDPALFRQLAARLNIWDDPNRSSYKGVLEVFYKNETCFFVQETSPFYTSHMNRTHLSDLLKTL